jgi:hypothetical protein
MEKTDGPSLGLESLRQRQGPDKPQIEEIAQEQGMPERDPVTAKAGQDKEKDKKEDREAVVRCNPFHRH